MVAVWLAATNPTMDTYLQFVEARWSAEIDKMDQSGPRRDRDPDSISFRARPEIHGSLSGRIRDAEQLGSAQVCFETNVLDQPGLVLGIGGQFVPLRGVEEATVKVGRLAF